MVDAFKAYITYEHPDIIFMRADKDNITVSRNRKEYNRKMFELLNDTSTYEIVKKNQIKVIETKLNELLKR